MKSQMLFSKLTRLTLTLTVLLTTFAASVSATPAPSPLKEPEPPWPDDYVLDVLPGWAQQPPPPEPIHQAMPQPSMVERAVVENSMFARATTNVTGPNAPVGPNSIAGSEVTSDGDCYISGDTATMCFTAHNASPDEEWLDAVSLTFPTGWTVACNSQDATDYGGNVVDFTCAAAGNSVTYSDNDGGSGEIYDGQSWGFCVDVAALAVSGSQTVDWDLSGDDWGGDPHDVSGTLSIDECPPLDLIPDTLQAPGCAALSQTHTLDLFNNTGVSTTFAITYGVSGNASISGTTSLYITDTETVSFDVELTLDACQYVGTQITATVRAAGGGYSDTTYITKTIATELWKFMTPVTETISLAGGAVVSDDLYVMAGRTNSDWGRLDECKVYNAPTDSWSDCGTLNQGRVYLAGASDGTYPYALGGRNSAGTIIYANVERYAGGAWVNRAALPSGRVFGAAVGYGNYIYYIGGTSDAGGTTPTTTMWRYDPGTNTWNQTLTQMPVALYGLSTTAYDGEIYVFPGLTTGDVGDDHVYIYDIAGDSWTTVTPTTQATQAFFHSAVTLDGQLYRIGGMEWTALDSINEVWVFDPTTNDWATYLSLNEGRFNSVAGVLGGSIYAAVGVRRPGWTNINSIERLVFCPKCTEIGWLEGYVMDSETGDVDPTCTDAVVHVEPGNLDVPVDPSGYYWAELISGTHTLEATAPGFSLETAVVDITTGVTTTEDFNLWRPVITVTPDSFISYTAYISQPVTYTLSISNDGHLPLDFEIRELPPASSFVNVLSEPESTPGIEVEAALLTHLEADETADYMIYFRERPDLAPALEMDWHERGWFVMNTLQAAAERAQARVRAYLDAQGADYQAFWIDNVIVVHNSDRATFDGLMRYSEIAALRTHRIMGIIEPVEKSVSGNIVPMAVESNISHVNADQVWGLGYMGEGVIVANIDTGVRYTHETLEHHYRGCQDPPTCSSVSHDYNWLDADTSNTTPYDDHGHGSHTMGTMIGDDTAHVNQIGMAPGARWIACDACNASTGCSGAALLTCAQWIAAPYPIGDPGSPDPDMRPHVVNNSWGDCATTYDNWYQASVDSWHAAGIYPIFSNGNASNCSYPEPPGLNTVGNPARYGNVTGVGSTGQNNGQYATHSNWGPTDDPDTVNPEPGYADLKPQVVAPGVNIRSSLNGSDSDYDSWGGTSMSAPHVAGLIALMWQAAPCLVGDYATTETIIEDTAVPIPYDDGIGSGPRVPNHATGWGEIDALAAVQAAEDYCNTDWLSWASVDPVSGTVPITSMFDVDVTFHCTETRDYTGTLRILHNDPCASPVDVPIELHCQERPPEPAWEKEVWVNGLLTATYPFAGPITVVPSDTVEIVERVYITYTSDVTFTLVETWTESLEAISIGPPSVGVVNSSSGWAEWNAYSVAPNTWHVLTKTFNVTGTGWLYDYVTETLAVEDADTQLDDRVVTFQRGCVPPTITDLQSDSPVALGDAMHFTSTVSGDMPITYTWNFDDGTPEQTGALTTTSHTYATAGTYTVTLMVDNGCAPTNTDFIVVTVNPEPIYYTLTVATDGTGTGTVNPSVGTHSYLSGTVVPITATAGLNSTFDGWSGALTGSTNPTSITMDGHKVVTATFNLIPGVYYTLTVATDGTGVGTVDPSVGTHSYLSGTVVPITATAGLNSTFDGWSGALSGSTNPTSITMDGHKMVTATFTTVCTEVTGVNLTYTNTGTIYTDTVVYFSADIAPNDADMPYTYTIDYGSGPTLPNLSSADPYLFTYTFPITGTHTVTFSAWNCAMIVPVSGSVSVPVSAYGEQDFFLYLPVVMRNY